VHVARTALLDVNLGVDDLAEHMERLFRMITLLILQPSLNLAWFSVTLKLLRPGEILVALGASEVHEVEQGLFVLGDAPVLVAGLYDEREDGVGAGTS